MNDLCHRPAVLLLHSHVSGSSGEVLGLKRLLGSEMARQDVETAG